MKRVAIIQSSYIPWRGYFAAIARCDTFVYLDSVQFTRRDWRTRNAIRTSQGVHWLSVPVMQKGNFRAPIDQIRIANPNWWRKHLKAIELAYRRAGHFDDTFPFVRQLFEMAANLPRISEVNQYMTKALCQALGIRTCFVSDVDLLPRETLSAMQPTERLVRLSAAVGAGVYLSGPSAKNYLRRGRFRRTRYSSGVDGLQPVRGAVPANRGRIRFRGVDSRHPSQSGHRSYQRYRSLLPDREPKSGRPITFAIVEEPEAPRMGECGGIGRCSTFPILSVRRWHLRIGATPRDTISG